MATVFMKWLETNPKDYDRGIRILTLGRLRRINEHIAYNYAHEGTRVLEIGCGTGTLSVMMAERGALVTGIDASPAMLAEAQAKAAAAGVEERMKLMRMDAAMIGENLSPASFDIIVSTLVFSELLPDEQRYVLDSCAALLAPGGRLLIADEVIPSKPVSRLLYHLVRLPLVLLTWLLTRTTTKALHEFETTLIGSGFEPRVISSYLGGSLVMFEIQRAQEVQAKSELPPTVVGYLRHRVTLRTLLVDLWTLFFRIIPPYPKVRPGLYAVGQPDRESPVLVTGNFDLTVRRLVQAIDGKVDTWVLVVNSAGINVWCAAGGGFFTAEKVIASIKTTSLEKVVNHHALVLPQLCANGVDGWRIRQETGWGVHWGPVRARDIPAYLGSGGKKTDAMHWVNFPLKERLEMVTVTLGFYGLLILLPIFFFIRPLFWPVTVSMVTLSYFYAVVHPKLPGRDGLWKGIPLTLITLAGLLAYTAIWNPLPSLQLFHWGVGLTGLSVFIAAELQGMSPLMRGEQANWGWEAVIGITLGLIYWLVPLGLGWK